MSERVIIRVRDVMKKKYDIVDGMTTIQDALTKMRHTETKCLIVEKRHDDDEYGIVMLSDIAKQVLAKDRASERVNVYEVMSKPVITVDPEMDIRYCARMFEKFGLSRAPVIEDRKLIGFITLRDIIGTYRKHVSV